ncbi:1-phosphatidylinositol 4,5-bisphosphate phosphodiesterase classes I and II isoform X2 [Coccinella septempunctata]|uniref:1-phosphatidylinositol 4,5-bisphosphate phosphodiesterase classes I and II isoform X2 n=1 Tax=Coccinella septempunctata TaxID=41139 RepID=UPI001D07CA79|nr:1-phosphatidylinositol 4,5-bisphosphate phosphodiesterase classes I and II isoform X2 [Coccinella septempunctata]
MSTVGKSAQCVNSVSLKPIEVPQPLQSGEKFIKWDEDSCIGVPVTLKVDRHGFYLHWVDQNHEMDVIDISTIRDVRTGKQSKIPKDPKLRQIVAMGIQDTLEEKTVTVCCANDFVNINFINFCCTKKEIARLWTDSLMSLAYNLNQINGTTNIYLQKAYTKLTLITDKAGKIPIKNIVKMFGQHKDDKKRIESCLSSLGLPTGKNETVDPQFFTFKKFYDFYEKLTLRITDVGKVFDKMTDSRRELSSSQFVDFLNKTQRDPRLNEILHPYANSDRANEIIAQYEEDKQSIEKNCLSFQGFLKYLLSEDNNIMSSTKFDLNDDMDQTLAHYFINSSHNTYLTGHQITGRSSTEMYRQSLLAGCRCVELDFWNGRTDEPVIVHGYTFVPEISAKEVLEAIAESAFKTSDYPVILSFENHCNPKQQAKIANYCREIFGDMLLDAPLDAFKVEPGVALPPPSALKRKIIIKNKKKHHHHHHKKNAPEVQSPPQEAPTPNAETEATGNGSITRHPPLQTRQSSKESTGTEDEGSTSEEENESVHEPIEPTEIKEEGGKKQSETEAGAEISALVNYVQPVHFSSFENAKKKNRCYEMSSFDERQATSLLKEYPVQFVNYNKHQLSRVYPVGTRFDSSNFMPQVFWNAGCQLVALNYQTLDLAMQLNVGIFEYNFRCGYLLKPEFMRRTDRRFYPFAESTVDGIIAGTVKITVISGQFLSDKRVGTYVEAEMYGLPADTVRKRFRTKVVPNNGINPIYDEEPFVFKKVVLPELASIRIVVYEESGKFIGHRILPVVGLCPGYRHVNLRNEIGQPLPLATLFLHVVVKDYVPDGLSDFAEALANPIKYQSELEKRAQQLAVLTEDMEPIEGEGKDTQRKCPSGKVTKEQATNGSPVQRYSIPTGSQSMEVPNDVEFTNVPASCSADLATESTTNTNSLPKLSEIKPVPEPAEQIVAEPLEKLLENKLVKEKKLELEKKLDALRKKHAKKKSTFQTQKSSECGEKKPKLINMKLVKRLSSKNIISGVFSTESPSIEPLTDVADAPETVDEEKPTSLPRSQSERLLAINKDYMLQERELREKYHEIIFNTLEKVMKVSQSNQVKLLKEQYQRDTTELMRKLQADHREEVKALARKHLNKEQFTRIKKEVVSAVVDRGVSEREKLTQQFNEKQDELTRQHECVKEALNEHRTKAKAALTREFEVRLARLDGEASGGSQIECTN